MLLLYLLFEHSSEKVAVELPLDASVGGLKEAAHAAGGPPPPEQVLAVGAEEIRDSDETLLSELQQPPVSSEAVVGVRLRRRNPCHKTISIGSGCSGAGGG
eukprot:TRINITY_DN4612_c0_g2_i4.p2 TRINITY_DN4612_c0_g2~~TRINITY_DN4612_c0_g2_i4.p2  ORF type:complete len:101 (+),score=34.48 TRINITY_DN4612_c0_g2_i4:80-382(+)